MAEPEEREREKEIEREGREQREGRRERERKGGRVTRADSQRWASSAWVTVHRENPNR
jgi:hypothetical protein